MREEREEDAGRSSGGDDLDVVSGVEKQPGIKDRAKALSDQALSKNVFGSPFFIADGEPFWGWDRLPMLDEWLRTGGW